MKEIIYFNEMCPPRQVRIVSSKLCLDHTFTVGAAETCIGYDDVLTMMQSNLIEDLFVCFDDGTAYMPNIDGSLLPVLGWYPIRQSELELKPINEYYYTFPGKK